MIHHQLSEIVTICQLLEVLNQYHGFCNQAASNMDTVGSLRTLEVIRATLISIDPTVCTISSYIDRHVKADYPRLKVVLITRIRDVGVQLVECQLLQDPRFQQKVLNLSCSRCQLCTNTFQGVKEIQTRIVGDPSLSREQRVVPPITNPVIKDVWERGFINGETISHVGHQPGLGGCVLYPNQQMDSRTAYIIHVERSGSEDLGSSYVRV